MDAVLLQTGATLYRQGTAVLPRCLDLLNCSDFGSSDGRTTASLQALESSTLLALRLGVILLTVLLLAVLLLAIATAIPGGATIPALHTPHATVCQTPIGEEGGRNLPCSTHNCTFFKEVPTTKCENTKGATSQAPLALMHRSGPAGRKPSARHQAPRWHIVVSKMAPPVRLPS